MKIKTVGFPGGLPPGTYDVDAAIEQPLPGDGSEPVMVLRFKPQPEPGPYPNEYLLVEVQAQVAGPVEQHISDMAGVVGVTVHGDGCCCNNCPWKGNHTGPVH